MSAGYIASRTHPADHNREEARSHGQESAQTRLFSAEYLLGLTKRVFQACGAPAADADIVADVLVSSNLMGLDSHGVIRIPQYVDAVQRGAIKPGAPIVIESETSGSAIVDAGWNFGLVGGVRGMEVAIERAKRNSIGCVLVRNCYHSGRLGAYPQMAAERNMLGMAMCSSLGDGHWVAPWGGREGRLATNPIAFAAPSNGNPILMDISTSVVAEGKIRVIHHRGEALPEGCILDSKGCDSNDTNDFYSEPMGTIMPLGGTSGYKGYYLSVMVEIMSRVLLTDKYPPGDPGAGGCGLWLMAMDIGAFTSVREFLREMDELIAYLKSSPLAEGFTDIVLPGEIDFLKMEQRKKEGIPVENSTWEKIESTVASLGVGI